LVGRMAGRERFENSDLSNPVVDWREKRSKSNVPS